MSNFGATHDFTALIPKFDDVDPDDAFSSVPYQKGSTFLYFLETQVLFLVFVLFFHHHHQLGGPEVFEPFLRAYIDNFKYQSITTTDFQTYLFSYFSSKEDKV